MTILYEDEYIICDDDALTIRCYYFPFGDKRIPYKKINKVSTQEMTWWTGKTRIWGGSLSYWLNLDPKRPWKDKLIIIDEGELTKPVITPDNPEQVYQILLSKVSS
ncbi:hypothetical protein [Cyanobacterium aponinum]|uniref:Uncharacterized protein n=1 Tax=Cyanobacterium aponinum 0216 TaxID=2676140 RepID=A0A844GM21_9CHRO|nr:hypothetical protein [Cyanobacterium aponinum]MTF37517.1 hypothetical protein [Cyanobacterium aponinum 0216]PHV63749.1 hypothetical protein CSQ80_04040 [Cyanobacterium aponinum IPPAS B-1201]